MFFDGIVVKADVKTISGAFTGSYALHPFTGEKIEIWIADYVLAGYGSGAVMVEGKMQDDASWKQCKVMVDLATLIAEKDPEYAALYGL